MNTDLLLIDSFVRDFYERPRYRRSMSLKILKKMFDDNGADTRVLDPNLEKFRKDGERSYQKLTEHIKSIDPGYIGIRAVDNNIVNVLILSRYLKKQMPETEIFLGGPQPTTAAEDILQNFESVDFIVRGEAEKTVPELAKYFEDDKKLGEIPNIIYRKDGEVVETPQAALLDGENIPKIIYEKPVYRKEDEFKIEGGRGCPFDCRFCSTSKYWKKKYRVKPTRRLLEEIRENVEKNGFKHVNIYHDNFGIDRRNIQNLCKAIKNLDITWQTTLSINTVDKKLLETMEESGCKGFFVGIESGDQDTLDEMNKKKDLKRAKKTLGYILDKTSMGLMCSFIIGFPEETVSSIDSTIKLAVKLKEKGSNIVINHFVPHRGSELYKEYESKLEFEEIIYDFLFDSIPINREEEISLIKRHPEIFSFYYKIPPENFSRYYPIALTNITTLLLSLIPETLYIWIQGLEGEKIVHRISDIMDWSHKTKITEEDLKKSMDKENVLNRFKTFFENHPDKKMGQLYKKEIEDNLDD